jgi:chromosome partitioning protein
MRGRRRGRNRPSPPSPSSAGSAQAPGSGGTGAVKLLDLSEADEELQEESAASEQAVGSAVLETSDSPTGASSDSPTVDSADSSSDDLEDGPVESTADAESSAAPTVEADEPTPEEPAEVTPESEATAAPATSETPEKVEEATPEEPAASSAAAPAEKVAVAAPAGRQPQAASGNPLPRILAVANQKGGVGKTTTSVNLGAALAELGFRVLVIDLDPQGNATTGLGIDARNFELSMYDVLMRDSSLEDCVEPTSMKNLFVAPATIALAGAEIELVPAFSRELKLKRAIESVIDDFDYVLIDCPPSLGLITVNALAAADEVLVPIQCEYYALEGLSQLMRNVHLVASNLNPRLDISTIVLTMYDARTKLSDQVATEVREHFGNKVCRIVIPRTVRLSEAPSFGQPITAFDPASRGAIAYRELAKEVSGGTS